MKQIAAVLCALLLTAACASPALRETELHQYAPRKAERDLSSGIHAYEDGDYSKSARFLENALAGGLLLTYDKVVAYKYLGFIYCAQSREKACRKAFRKALELDPKLELTPAEAGHPLWAPTFYSIKSQLAERAQAVSSAKVRTPRASAMSPR